jgi:glucose-1-phosphate adenylyltransferase
LDYWKDVGTYDSYLETNLELTKSKIQLDLYDPTWRIFTKSEELPPVKIGKGALIHNSLISNGCIIYGKVINSVLSPGVIVDKGAVVTDSVVLNNTIIKNDCKVTYAIIDKNCLLNVGVEIGESSDVTPNIEQPTLLFSGISVLAKGTKIPKGVKIGKNCRIFTGSKLVEDQSVPSGSTLR